jgi:hypothetical protein
MFMPRKRHLKAGNLADLQRILWATIVEVEALLDARPPSNDLVLKSAHAIAQLAGAYRGICEVVDFESRLAKLESAAATRRDDRAKI